MTDTEKIRMKLAMEIIRGTCYETDDCDGCPFEEVCESYRMDTGRKPVSWRIK